MRSNRPHWRWSSRKLPRTTKTSSTSSTGPSGPDCWRSVGRWSRTRRACSDPALSRQEIADRVGCNPVTVTKWRNRFAQQRLDGLIDEPRPGAARKIGDDVIEQVVIDTLESAPADATPWSTRSLAAKHGISHQTVAEAWRAFGSSGRLDQVRRISVVK